MAQRDEKGNAEFARYRLIECLGSDEIVERFRAETADGPGRQRPCVIKKIRPRWAQSPEFVFMLQDELRRTRLLEHPNIAPLRDAGRLEGALCLETPLLEGAPLSSVLDTVASAGGHLPVHVAAFVAHEVASALAYAHDTQDDDGRPLHLVHHAVTPENIWLLASGEVRLVDFGLAKAVSRLRTSAGPEPQPSPASYVSPEQAMGLRLDGRSDLYSLGVVLWEMLAGRALFRAEDALHAAHLIMCTRVPRPSAVRRQPCKALDAVVMRALQRSLEERYQSAGAMGSDMGRFLFACSDPRRALRVLLRDLATLAAEQRPPRPRRDRELVIMAQA